MEEKIEVEMGSGNVFADLGLPHPEERQLKAHLSIEIEQAIKNKRLSQKQAAQKMGLEKQELIQVLNGRLADCSINQLVEFLHRLDYDVELFVSVRERQPGETQKMAAMA